jgi:hypothetical protein
MLYPTELRAQPLSGAYYGRLHVAGKLIRKSLKTDVLSVARLRLTHLDKQRRQRAESGDAAARGGMTAEGWSRAQRKAE